MIEPLDDYGKQCFEAGKVAARMEGLTGKCSLVKIILNKHIICRIDHIHLSPDGLIIEIS